jgi:hypothetical protein
MQVVPREEAVQKLTHQIPLLQPDGLAEVHKELFPEPRITEDQVRQNKDRVLARIMDHMSRGLEAEEIEALWVVVFSGWPTGNRRVRYDEELDAITYYKASESLPDVDWL